MMFISTWWFENDEYNLKNKSYLSMAIFWFYSGYNGFYECQIEFTFEHVDQSLC